MSTSSPAVRPAVSPLPDIVGLGGAVAGLGGGLAMAIVGAIISASLDGDIWLEAKQIAGVVYGPAVAAQPGFAAGPVIVGTLLHETGHALFSIYRVPILGREEDAADQIAGFVMLQFGRAAALTTIKGSAWKWANQDWSNPAFHEVHSTPQQRFYNFLCMAYGGDPDTFKQFVDVGWLPKWRAPLCAAEYQQVKLAFETTIAPQLDLDLTKRLLKYPCSYMIYSDLFEGLPAPAKDRIYRGLWDALTGSGEGSEKLSAEDRRAVLEILIETKSGLPPYWKLPLRSPVGSGD